MPSTKISNLTLKSEPVSADVLPIVDSVDGLNKKITAGTLPISSAVSSALVLKADKYIVRSYSASDTWTKPSGLISVEVQVFSGGGGGSSGRVDIAGTIRVAGGSGATGCGIIGKFNAGDLPSSITVTVGAGGIGGAASSSNVVNLGGAGGTSSFGTLLSLAGANGGLTSNAAVALFTTSTFELMAGLNGSPSSSTGASGTAGTSSPHLFPTPGSGAGGGITATNTSFNGGAGGARTGIYRPAFTAATATAGQNANLCTGTYFGQPLGGGAGGGQANIVTPGAGGGSAVGICGAGAGGGCSQNSISGAGGNGFRGCVIVIEYY